VIVVTNIVQQPVPPRRGATVTKEPTASMLKHAKANTKMPIVKGATDNAKLKK
jgi:hypothetical protein